MKPLPPLEYIPITREKLILYLKRKRLPAELTKNMKGVNADRARRGELPLVVTTSASPLTRKW